MKIDGKKIADAILQELKKDTDDLINNKDIIPNLVIILIGNDPASVSYVKAKKTKGEKLGCLVKIETLPNSITQKELFSVIARYNNDNSVHGIIVQRPVPTQINKEELDRAIIPEKDIDGFNPQSPFEFPIAIAVLEILHFLRNQSYNVDFNSWLNSKKITVIGKGETGGGPVIKLLKKLNVNPTVIDSKTQDPEAVVGDSDIIISAVGKPNIFNASAIKEGSIVINLGMHKENGKFYGDFNEKEVEQKASFYTPTPGGVGPITVACLLKNLISGVKNNLIYS